MLDAEARIERSADRAGTSLAAALDGAVLQIGPLAASMRKFTARA
jgi:hypothetical protein